MGGKRSFMPDPRHACQGGADERASPRRGRRASRMETAVTDLSEQVCGGVPHAAGEAPACRQGYRIMLRATVSLRQPCADALALFLAFGSADTWHGDLPPPA